MTRKKQKRTTKSIIQRTTHYARNATVPQRKNAYRPHVIRWQGLIMIVAIIVSLQFVYNIRQTGSVLGRHSDVTSRQLLDETNHQRKKQGIGVLKLNDRLNRAAHQKAADMFAEQYWAHISPSGVAPWKWFNDAGYRYVVAGENLAKNFSTTDGVISAWMNSPEHRKNVLDARYQDVGFAVVSGMLDSQPAQIIVALYGEPRDGVAMASIEDTGAPAVLAAQGRQSLASQLGTTLQTLNPSVLASLILILVVIVVSLLAHTYRKKLPKDIRLSWRRHHGLYKAIGASCFVMVILALYSGGQI